MLHSLYLPSCDLWRTDNHVARVLASARVPNHEKIVPDLSELLTRIEKHGSSN